MLPFTAITPTTFQMWFNCFKQKSPYAACGDAAMKKYSVQVLHYVDYYMYLCPYKGVPPGWKRLRLYPVNLMQVMLPEGLCTDMETSQPGNVSPPFCPNRA